MYSSQISLLGCSCPPPPLSLWLFGGGGGGWRQGRWGQGELWREGGGLHIKRISEENEARTSLCVCVLRTWSDDPTKTDVSRDPCSADADEKAGNA